MVFRWKSKDSNLKSKTVRKHSPKSDYDEDEERSDVEEAPDDSGAFQNPPR